MVNVLIVDDEPNNLDLLEEILVEYGFNPTTAQSIEEAVAIGTSQQFEVVLMDMAIPQLRYESPLQFGGLEAVRRIHAKVGRAKVPVIAVTAQGMPEARQKIFAAGITHIVEKSIEMEQRIVGALEAVLGRCLQIRASSSVASKLEESNVVSSESDRLVAGSAILGKAASLQGVPTTVPSDAPPLKIASSQTLDVLSEPSTGNELRRHIGKSLEYAERTVRRLIDETVDAERPPTLSPLLASLHEKLGILTRRLHDESDGPSPGENYGHWIVNLILGADRDVRKLKKLEDEHHFGALSAEFAALEACFEQAFQAAKSPAGLQRVPALEPVSPLLAHSYGIGAGGEGHPATEPSIVAARLPTETAVQPPSVTVASNALDEESSPPKPSSRREIPPEHRLILIVDDNSEARRDLEEKLQQLRYRVVSCENARQALMFIETMRFDVCLVDLDMPEVNGLDLIKKIRSSTTSSDASIIVVSGSSELFTASEAIDGGADDYLEKPANRHFLQSRIRSCLRQSDARLAELSRFLPEDVAKRVSSNRELLETAVPADISVMVCDIRGFSRVSERVGPMRTIKWISDVMNRLSKIILNRGGTIIDYVGDEIMAMWGAPIASQDHATDACNCALAIQKAVEELSEKWLPIVGSRMEIGVGINSGLAVVGNTGSKDRIKFGPLGNTVNLASRVQGATKYLHSSVLITQETAGRIDAKLRGRRICAVRVQNIIEPVNLYELAVENQDDASCLCCRLYTQALEAFEKQELDTAILLLAELLKESPQDGPAKLLMMRVIQNQLGGTFDPVWTLPGK